jgi:hypothetical protein
MNFARHTLAMPFVFLGGILMAIGVVVLVLASFANKAADLVWGASK